MLRHPQEQEQLAAIRESLNKQETTKQSADTKKPQTEQDRDFEGGFGGQEDLEDRYVESDSRSSNVNDNSGPLQICYHARRALK